MNTIYNITPKRTNKTAQRILPLIILSCILLFSCIALTSCNPALPLNPRYAYSSFGLEIGQTVPEDIGEYVDLSSLSSEDADFVRVNTEILYDGVPVHEMTFNDAGEHTLTINYCGRRYRQYAITVTDRESPVFKKARSIYTFVGIELPDEEFENLFAAEDNSGQVKLTVKKPDVDYDKAGRYEIRAVAEDPSGNRTEASADVVVQKPEYGAEGTYVFVSIDNQHMTYFVDGKPVVDCPVVTGNINSGHGTPRGTFRLNYKSRNVTLKGTEANGDQYEAFVNYWMAFIGSEYGLHDALWRGSFGGQIYRGGGSHGCINMPYKAAGELYKLLEPGTPVLVY